MFVSRSPLFTTPSARADRLILRVARPGIGSTCASEYSHLPMYPILPLENLNDVRTSSPCSPCRVFFERAEKLLSILRTVGQQDHPGSNTLKASIADFDLASAFIRPIDLAGVDESQ